VLELACGPGVWTGQLLRYGSDVTAVDASPEMLFADDAYRTPDELLEGPSSSTIRRQIPNGTAYRIVKVPYQPADLERELHQLGWDIKVSVTAGPFYWGAESRGRRPA
jgi:SAM-dependent methyltransferase